MTVVLIVPIVYVFMNGKGMSSYKSSYTIELAKTSLGNVEHGDRTMYLFFTAADLLSMIILFVFYLHWRSFHAEMVSNEVKDPNLLNPVNFALTVVGFDVTTPNLEKNLEKYITDIVTPVY